MFKWLKNKFHLHLHQHPIASQYVSFHQRDIIFECKCGHRILQRVVADFSEPFPIETNILITNAEMQKILNGSKL